MNAGDHARSGAADDADVHPGVRVLSKLIPAGDRQAILGDLLEDATCRGIRGARLQWWLLGECGAIAAGLSVARARGWLVLPPVREVVSGLAVDGRGALRAGHVTAAVLRTLIFCGSIATIVLGVAALVSALLSAGDLGR
jgi:hypothetical protein